jgi:AcrR family transcriptional regulator
MDGRNSVIKYRIIAIAARRLVRRRFNKVPLSDISHNLIIERIVLKHYFSTTEDLVTAVIDSVVQNIESILLSFIDDVMVPQINRGDLQITKDHLHFANERLAVEFNNKLIDHLEALFDYLLTYRDTYSLLVQESLVFGEHHGCLDRLLRLFLPIDANPLYQKIRSVAEIRLEPEAQISILQTNILPSLCYATMKESLERLVPHAQEAYKLKILADIRAGNARHIIGPDIFFHSETIEICSINNSRLINRRLFFYAAKCFLWSLARTVAFLAISQNPTVLASLNTSQELYAIVSSPHKPYFYRKEVNRFE